MIWKNVTILVILAFATIHTSENKIYKSLKRLLSHRKRCHKCPLSLNGFRRTLPTINDASTATDKEKVNFDQVVSDIRKSKYTYNGPDENSTENKINNVPANSKETGYFNEDAKVLEDNNEPNLNNFQELNVLKDSQENGDGFLPSLPAEPQALIEENVIGADLNEFHLENINRKHTDPNRNLLSNQYVFDTQPNLQIIKFSTESPNSLVISPKLSNKSHDLIIPIDGNIIKQNKSVPRYLHIVRPSQYDQNSDILKLLLRDYQKHTKLQQQNMKIDMIKNGELRNPYKLNTKRGGDFLRNNKKLVMKSVPVANLVLQNRNIVISPQQLPYFHNLEANNYDPYVLHKSLVTPPPYILDQAFIDETNKKNYIRNIIDEDSNIDVDDSISYRDHKNVLQYFDDAEDITGELEKSTRNAIETSNNAKEEKHSFEYLPYIHLGRSNRRALEPREELRPTDVRRNHRYKPLGFLQDLFSKLTSSLLTLFFQIESNGEFGSETLISKLMPFIMQILQTNHNSRSSNENPLSILQNIFSQVKSLLSSPFANDKSGSTTKAKTFLNNDSLKRSGSDRKTKSRLVSQKLDEDVPVELNPLVPAKKSALSSSSGNFKIPIKAVLSTGTKDYYYKIISNFNGQSNLRYIQPVPIQPILRVSAKEISPNTVPIISTEEKDLRLTNSRRPVYFLPSKQKYISRFGIIPQESSPDMYVESSENYNVTNIASKSDKNLNEKKVPILPNEPIVSASEEDISFNNSPIDIDKEDGGLKNGKWSAVAMKSRGNFESDNGIKAQDHSLGGLSGNENIDNLVSNSYNKNSLENAYFTAEKVGLRNRKQHDLVWQDIAASRDGFVPEELPVDVSTDLHEHENEQEITSTKTSSLDEGKDEQNFDFLMGYDDEDDDGDFRIIGGNAATGSGTPLSNRGRSGRLV